MRHVFFLTVAALLVAGATCHPASTTKNADAGVADAGLDCTNAASGSTQTITVASQLVIGQAGVPDQMVTIPSGCYSSIVVNMTVSSECVGYPVPSGQDWPTYCDPYDRLAQTWLDDPNTTPLFMLDAVTSFGGTASWSQDVTDYASAMFGTHAWAISVGTYDEPPQTGSMSSHTVDVTVTLTPGVPPHDVLAVVPIFRTTISNSTPLTDMVTPPSGTTSGRVDYFTSGHGGNVDDAGYPCDEFCMKTNVVTVGTDQLYDAAPWVTCNGNCTEESVTEPISCGDEDFYFICEQNPTSCPSSAVAPRSNWCPSQIIQKKELTWPSDALSGASNVSLQVVGVDGDWSVGLAAVFFK